MLLLCLRCKYHINSNKDHSPRKAYWNNLDPNPIPRELQELTQIEIRLLARIKPFIKIIKFDGVLGQYGFRAQAVLFAQDLHEVTEKLPNMLLRPTNNLDVVVVTETLENLNIPREFSIDRSSVNRALKWLVAENELYKDVVIDQESRMEESDYVLVQPAVAVQEQEEHEIEVHQRDNVYMHVNDVSRIIKASWHQADETIFTSGSAGVQCLGMVLANIVRASILERNRWTSTTLSENMIEDDDIYQEIVIENERRGGLAVEEDGYLEILHMNVIKHDVIMYNNDFSIEHDDNTSYVGSLSDSVNDGELAHTLESSLNTMFNIDHHKAGALIAEGYSYGVMRNADKYYFTDSHSCGAVGGKARGSNRKACVIECGTFDELLRVCKRATGSKNVQYTMNYIDVHVKDNIVRNYGIDQEAATQEIVRLEPSQAEAVPLIQASVMAPID
ncbi:hypothetical protein AVEN_184281-1 [Araneus ventricosus]|uniref:DUF6570 domain-containing protein n=1 Tax=Araneus ventricosus TaxID=182803 RepID=A0A4Y2L6H2_ARAVE|nr:hypothetical protein AVEN_184281-1 [Araneus ventricosus]